MIINQANIAGLYRSFSTIFNKSYAEAATMYQDIAMTVTGVGRSSQYAWLGAYPAMKEWIGERVFQDLQAYNYEIVNKRFTSEVAVDLDDIADDQYGIYTPLFQGYGSAAKVHNDQLIFPLLKAGFATVCYDGQYFFDTDHPVAGASVANTDSGSGTGWYLMDLSRPLKPLILQNRELDKLDKLDKSTDENVFMRNELYYGVKNRKNVGFGMWQHAWGSKQTLNSANYVIGRKAMMSFKNDSGISLGIMPTHLVVPPSLEEAGRNLLLRERLDAGASNTWYKTAELLVIPWLE